MKKIKTRQQAKRRGYIVDTHCYPWFGYKGPRFAPTASIFGIETDKETELRRALYMTLTVMGMGILFLSTTIIMAFNEPDRRPVPQPEQSVDPNVLKAEKYQRQVGGITVYPQYCFGYQRHGVELVSNDAMDWRMP